MTGSDDILKGVLIKKKEQEKTRKIIKYTGGFELPDVAQKKSL